MNPTLTFATAGRVLRQLAADRRTLALILIVPCLLMGLLAWMDVGGRLFTMAGPALLGVFPFVLMFVVTSVATLRERSSGTLERLLASPLGRGDFLVGYALAFGVTAAVQACIVTAFAVWVCGLEVAGPLWWLLLVAIVNAILGTALGLLASAFARTEFQAVQFMPVFVFPQILLGGLLMPRDQMPDVLTAISDWLPLSYVIDAVNAVSAGDEGWDLGKPLVVIGAVTVVSLGLAALTLRRRTP